MIGAHNVNDPTPPLARAVFTCCSMFSCQPAGSDTATGAGVTAGFVPVPHVFRTLLAATAISLDGASRCTNRASPFSALTQATVLPGAAGCIAPTGDTATPETSTTASVRTNSFLTPGYSHTGVTFVGGESGMVHFAAPPKCTRHGFPPHGSRPQPAH